MTTEGDAPGIGRYMKKSRGVSYRRVKEDREAVHFGLRLRNATWERDTPCLDAFSAMATDTALP
jgi:hypothetical protein